MAFMMKVCGLHERNSGADGRYGYLSGWIDASTKLVVMPNRDPAAGGDEWILYLAAYPPEEAVPADGDPPTE